MSYKVRKTPMKILVVDDEELICWSLKRTLERQAGYEVCCVYNGKDALEKLIENDYDLLISDIRLPDINGHELLKQIKELGINIPVIIISSYLTDDILDYVKSYGVNINNCLSKPFHIEDVLYQIKNIATVAIPAMD